MKYNCVKKKSNFPNKSNGERVAKHQSTDKGSEKHRADERIRMSESCKTPGGKKKHADERSRMSKLLKGPEGKDINHERVGKLLKNAEGKEKNYERVAKICETGKGIEKHCADESSGISKTCKADKTSIEKAFIEVTEESMVDPSILHTDAFEIISPNWEKIKNKFPEYTCVICIKQEWEN